MGRAGTTYCCTYPGCGVFVDGSRRCENHKKRLRYDYRKSSVERGYDWNWKKLQKRKIKQDPLCERHLEKGQAVAATIVHHRIPIDVDPRLRLVMTNLMSVCPSCHQELHKELDGDGRM